MFTAHRGAWWLALVGAAVVVACGGKKRETAAADSAAAAPATARAERAPDPAPGARVTNSASPGARAERAPDPAPTAEDPPAPPLYVVAHLQTTGGGGSGAKSLAGRIDWIHKLGFVGTRIGFEWPALEPERGTFQWADQDSVVAAARASGLEVIGVLLYTPPWARPAGAGGRHRPVVDGSAELGNVAFAHFAAVTARRYKGQVHGWEIWNEPNIKNFWAHRVDGRNVGPDPADYAPMYRMARDSILASVPGVTVLTAGLAPGPNKVPPPPARRKQPVGYPAAAYLNGLLNWGLRPPVIGLHPYTNQPIQLDGSGNPVNPVLHSVEEVLAAHDMPGVHVWITEWGVNANDASGEPEMRRWYDLGLHALVCDPRVKLVTVYGLMDTNPRERYGLVRDGAETDNGAALDSVLTSWKACP